MDGEKSIHSAGHGGKKQVRDQDKQRRRHLPKTTSHDRASGNVNHAPVFGKPVEKKDSELHKMTSSVLGDYNSYKTEMEWGKQTNYFGVADATPSTPIVGPKYSPFDSEFRAASSRGSPSSSGGASSLSKTSSRHQVAELPVSQQYFNKKDKTRTKTHLKHSLKGEAGSQRPPSNLLANSVKSSKEKDKEMKKSLNPGARTMAEGSSETPVQPTNVLKTKHKKVRPHRPQVTGSTTSSSSSSSSQGKTNSQSSSLFDFSSTSAGGTAPNSLAIQRTSSSSSMSTSSSKPKQLSASDRANSFTSASTSRHSESHVTSSHTSVAHGKHKKLASVLPTFGTSSQKTSEEEQSTKRVVSIKRTPSLEFVKEKGVASETVPATEETDKSGKKKKGKKVKKQKKNKKSDEVPVEKKINTSGGSSTLPMTSHTVVSEVGHVNTPESHVTTKSSSHIKSEPITRSRPSDLRITTGLTATPTTGRTGADIPVGGASVDEVSHDAGDVRSMLQEMMRPLDDSYSLVTPIPTPIKTRPFVFPTERSSGDGLGLSDEDIFKKPPSYDSSQETLMQVGEATVGRSQKLSCSSSDGESDSDNKMAVDLAMSTLDFNLAGEHKPQVPHPQQSQPRPLSPAISMCSSSSSSGESSSESSDSSSEEEGEGEESESNITPTLERLHRHTQLSSAAITPLKKTPPRVGLSSFLSPLADESANLSPAKSSVRISSSSVPSHSDNSMLTSQASTGFNPIHPSSSFSLINPAPSSTETTNIISYSSDSDSGSESDSESSDSEDQSSGEEDNSAKIGQLEVGRGDMKRASIQSSEEAVPPFGSSSGFWEEGYDLMSVTSEFGQNAGQMKVLGSEMTTFDEEQMDTNDAAATLSSQSNSKKQTKTGTKRKQSSDSPLSLRKAQKLMSVVQLSSDVEEGEAALSNSNPPRHLAPAERTGGDESESKVNISHLSASESELSDEEEGEIPSDDEVSAKKPPSRQQSMEAAHTGETHQNVASTNSLRSDQGGANSSQTVLIKQEALEEGEEEPHSLIVRFQLSSIPKLPMQKPKATVEPFYHRSTSSSKEAKRRNTVDAPGERDSDEVQPRGLSRDRGERNMYNRHREDYGRDYHRPARPHRDSSGRWDRESSRDRRMYGGSEERSGRHGGGRHSGWDRDGDYHRDDYWEGSGTHYDRGTRDYDRGSRQRGEPDRKRGAEYFMQEARRRKHEADKIQIAGVEKAKAYMESVPYFLKHGDAIEHERTPQQNQQWVESGSEAVKRKSFKMYSDTLSVVRFCQNMAGDCKPLVVVCLRCQSILLWRMFQLKQATSSHVQKELQEFFIVPKGTQSKSPYPNNFSPLPSPASVSSTASNGSGGGAFPQDPSPSCAVSVPKHVFNKASEHLAITGYINQSFDAWKKADTLMEQCRDFFIKAERKSVRLHQFSSSISQAASWVENMLRSLR